MKNILYTLALGIFTFETKGKKYTNICTFIDKKEITIII